MNTIALDVMGGDDAPAAPLSAALHFTTRPGCPRLALVGDRALALQAMATQPCDSSLIELVHAPAAILMDADPKAALAQHPDASIAVAARLVKSGAADALVSAGNTGAVVLACARSWQRLAGVARCALGAVYPTSRRRGKNLDPFSLILDAGLTLDVTAADLVAFAVMGTAYARIISKNPSPKVALLSNGTEANKGTAAVSAAHRLLAARHDLEFIGNIEGLDIPKGTADVVLTDGFVGNIVIKMLEGIADTVQGLLSDAADQSLVNKAGLALLAPALGELKKTTDWQQYGGAPLLGFEHVCIKAHGRSNARAIKNAIQVADRAVTSDLVGALRTGLAGL